MTLQFNIKKHYGRVDLYPTNEAARQVLLLKKKMTGNEKLKSISPDEVAVFKTLGFEVELIVIESFDELINELNRKEVK